MDINENTPQKEITIAGVTVIAPAPYEEGHVLKANEAAVLNQTLAENLRNNFASKVKAAIDEAGDVEEVDMEALQGEFITYVEGYEFGVRRTGTGGGPRLDPVTRIARDLAKAKVKEAIKAKGLKVSNFDAAQITELAMKLLESDDSYAVEAARRIEAAKEAADDAIDLSGLDMTESDAEVAA